jgi:hypothetical protein
MLVYDIKLKKRDKRGGEVMLMECKERNAGVFTML